jgi:hypothetical protein
MPIKTMCAHTHTVLATAIVCVTLVLGGCAGPPTDEGFAVYLTRNNIPPSQMAALSHVGLADEPVFAEVDVISYRTDTHDIALTDGAFARVAALEVPVQGTSFVVCVNRSPVYWGAFWTPISSLSFDGVTIWKPLGAQPSNAIRVVLGYPWPSLYEGDDPRNHPDILASLERSGKLIMAPPALGLLPRSMKGYELYSWEQGGEWHFTLITGTNRNKTLEEVTSTTPSVSADGLVHIHVVGVEALKGVLSRVPPSEFVTWLAVLHDDSNQMGIVIRLPPDSIVVDIRDHAMSIGLNLTATG